ncbi:MAG: beta-lactamase family protein, partial [Methylococcaceae bacterium]|nr:beta-lactamase family protein [Methylococcaceae bacterium]
MKLQTAIATLLFTGAPVFCAATTVTDNVTVDDRYQNASQQLAIPIVKLDAGRFSTQVHFSNFKQNADGSYMANAHIEPLQSLQDATDVRVDVGFDPQIAANLQVFLEEQVSKNAKPGAILRVDMNGKVWRGVIGKQRINSDQALNFSDRHRVGSISKTFVSNVIMQLVQEGILGLDTTIDQYIPEVDIHNKDKITVRHLINHRTGLYNYVKSVDQIQQSMQLDPLKVFTPYDLIAISNAQPVDFEPGTQYKYSNTGLILAGLIIEKVTGQDVEDVVYEKVLKPLNLQRTEFPKDPGIQSNYMHGQADYNNDGILESTEIVSYLDPSVSWAAGAVISNIPDLSRWSKAHIDGELLTSELQQQVLSDCLPSAPDYGASYCIGAVKLTWPFNTTDENNWWWGHLGQINGYDNAIFRNPKKDITISMVNTNYYLETPPEMGTGIFIFEVLNIIEPQTA